MTPRILDSAQCTDQLIDELVYREQHGYQGACWGVPLLDEMYPRGIEKGDLVIISGRPGQGKTAFIQTMIREQVRCGKRILFFSVEMNIISLYKRFLARESNIPIGILFGSDAHWKSPTAGHAIDTLRGLRDRLWVLPTENRFDRMIDFVKGDHGWKALKDIDGVYIDYIGLVRGLKAEARYREVAMYSHALKSLANELGIFCVVASQINRESQQGPQVSYARPKMSQLRESGDLEQDADVVAFVYQDKPDEKDGRECSARPVSIYIDKHRHEEPQRAVKTWFRGNVQKFDDSRPQKAEKAEGSQDHNDPDAFEPASSVDKKGSACDNGNDLFGGDLPENF